MIYNISNSSCINDTDGVCLFRIVNGSLIITLGVIGTTICGLITFNIVTGYRRLPGNQNLYILVLMMNNIMVSLLGIFRGIAIIDKQILWGVTEDNLGPNWFCKIYTLGAKLPWGAQLMLLLPISLDRFLAIVFPFRHRKWQGWWMEVLILSIPGIPLLVVTLWRIIEYAMQRFPIVYYHQYHRCVTSGREYMFGRTANVIIFTGVPVCFTISIYIFLFFFIFLTKGSYRKILQTSLFICISTLILFLPDIIAKLSDVELDYYATQVLNITVVYLAPISDGVIYYFSNPKIRGKYFPQKRTKSNDKSIQITTA